MHFKPATRAPLRVARCTKISERLLSRLSFALLVSFAMSERKRPETREEFWGAADGWGNSPASVCARRKSAAAASRFFIFGLRNAFFSLAGFYTPFARGFFDASFDGGFYCRPAPRRSIFTRIRVWFGITGTISVVIVLMITVSCKILRKIVFRKSPERCNVEKLCEIHCDIYESSSPFAWL